MNDSLQIRETEAVDFPQIESLYGDAFPDEDLIPLVRDLLRDEQPVLSLAAIARATFVGHLVLTRCAVVESDCSVALLGPLAVAQKYQRQGVGSAMVHHGVKDMEGSGVERVCVLGDPAYYGRFGFVREEQVEPPYPLPAEWLRAWQSISIGDAQPTCAGKLIVPQPWRNPALWGP